MSLHRTQEDDILEIVGKHLKSKQFYTLASGGNQAGLFSFYTKLGRRKAPDLVVFRNPVLAVFEAKVKASSLFSSKEEGASDYDCISFFVHSEEAQRQIIRKAIPVLKSLDVKIERDIKVVGGLIAGDDFSPHLKYVKDMNIVLLSVNVDNSSVKCNCDFEGFFK